MADLRLSAPGTKWTFLFYNIGYVISLHWNLSVWFWSVCRRLHQRIRLPIGLMRCDGRGMMVDRMKALRDANIFEPHSCNHVVSQPLITSRRPASVSVRTNFHVVRIMEDGRMDLFATGKYLDKIVVEEGQARFGERIVVLDSRCVDVLLVLPF